MDRRDLDEADLWLMSPEGQKLAAIAMERERRRQDYQKFCAGAVPKGRRRKSIIPDTPRPA